LRTLLNGVIIAFRRVRKGDPQGGGWGSLQGSRGRLWGPWASSYTWPLGDEKNRQRFLPGRHIPSRRRCCGSA